MAAGLSSSVSEVVVVSDKTTADVLQDHFKCIQCGECCRVGGQIRISLEEAQEIADYLCVDMGDVAFFPFQVRDDFPGTYFLEVTSPCFFWDKLKHTCMIEEVKPAQCRTYPFKCLTDGDCSVEDACVCPVFRQTMVVSLMAPVED